MNSASISEQAIDALAEIYAAQGYAPPPEEHRVKYVPFRPNLNPVQGECYDGIRTHLYNCLHGPRYSGKSIGGIQALVEHCRENINALGLIIVLTGRQGEEGGCWFKLNNMVLPEWKHGCGLQYTEPKTNKYKDVFIWISNRHGGWSRVVLLSMPFEGFVADRIKGMEPTFILVDEAQTLESATYFNSIVQQLGRNAHVKHQPIVYCCNPAGPSHWLYQRFFIFPYDEETGKFNKDYFVKQVPLGDNLKNVPQEYIRRLVEATKHDDTERRRMLLGEWIDAPTGESLFKNDYSDELHLRGDILRGIGFLPIKGVPIVTGWDLGAAHTSIHFQQILATKDRIRWIVFDEINCVDQYLAYPRLVPKVLERMEYWKKMVGYDFQFIHVSDNSAFNQFRATTGSFDVHDIEKLSQKKIKLVECPKGPHSVEARVRITKEKLHDIDLLISGACPKTREMFLNLEMDEDNPMKPKRSRFLHPMDSLTYPHLFYNVRKVPNGEEKPVEPQYYSVGQAA